ncbi:reverse transcriptase domain-containing protein, partial [Tanacetum coccineum]
MKCLYKEDDDIIFTLDEPLEEMGSEAIEVPALKEEEFAQITVLGLCVSFPNGCNIRDLIRLVLAMPSHSHKKFRWGTVFATRRRSFIEPRTGLKMKRINRWTRVLIGLYPCHIEEKMTIKEVKGESVMEWKTKEKVSCEEVWEKIEYVISDSDSDLDSTTMTANVNDANGENGNGGNDGCSYKSFTTYNPKEFDVKGGVVALTRWIENIESVFDNSGCATNQRVRYAASCFVNKALSWWNTQVQARGHEAAIGANYVAYTDRFHELAKLVPYLVNPESSRIKSVILTAGILTDEAVRCGTLTKGNDKRKEMEESSKQGSTWKDNKKSKTRSGYVATFPPKSDNVNTYPKCTKCYTFHHENAPCRLCYNCQKQGHFARQCWVPIRKVAPVNTVKIGQNQRACYECGSLDHLRYDCPKWKQAAGFNGFLLFRVFLFPSNANGSFWVDQCTSGLHGFNEP